MTGLLAAEDSLDDILAPFERNPAGAEVNIIQASGDSL